MPLRAERLAVSTCSACGGTRVNNILVHRTGCEFHHDTLRATTQAEATTDRLRLHPDLLALDADLDEWYPREAA